MVEWTRKTKKASSAKISVQVTNTPTAEKNTNYFSLEIQYQDTEIPHDEVICSQDIYMNSPLQADEQSAVEHSPEDITETKAISTLLNSENKTSPRLTSLQPMVTKLVELNHGEEYSHLNYSVDKKRYNLDNIYNM
ncbi:hypothetical protein Btru_063538 [Bulinus truncatus]|nr:hypothetical protein Btru_063538 [Bulinus truncatus]